MQHYEIHQTLKDSLFNEKGIKEIAQLEANYDFEKKKQALEFAQTQQLKQQQTIQTIMLAALGLALVIILIIARYYQAKQKVNLELNRLNSAFSPTFPMSFALRSRSSPA